MNYLVKSYMTPKREFILCIYLFIIASILTTISIITFLNFFGFFLLSI
jgi:hypothetical protein